ncbi:AAA family ATPase [Marivivens sp. LCG002]|uniref:AAA family ATPase n=1 Tax=Marivivens sp. LCG002 TaxID=3051171 RepID=UPI0025535197|nr:AAA family ATPase [Marivivens sp. LCG002]WIV52064.1 AAA family ATPase [Marivivens sp. LCG002]
MTKTLEEIAKQLRDANKKVQLIYAFNGTGKTRLSRAMKKLIAPRIEGHDTPARNKILYYSAFTEDLFYWDNDPVDDYEYKLMIQPNTFIDWILQNRGQEHNIVSNFQRYTSRSVTPTFPPETVVKIIDDKRTNVLTHKEVRFAYTGGNNIQENIKISKGEESNLIWSIFYALLLEVNEILKEPDPANRDDNEFDQLEYVFIDDPVSSLDENHLIELAVDLAGLISSSRFENGRGVKYVVTTHNPLFFNVLCKELNGAARYLLRKNAAGTYSLEAKNGAANKSFAYHHHLISELKEAIAKNEVQKFHFNLLRNIYEKTANFLGYEHWTKLLSTAPAGRAEYLKKLTNHFSHRELSFEEVAEPTDVQKEDVAVLLENLINNYGYWKQDAQDG